MGDFMVDSIKAGITGRSKGGNLGTEVGFGSKEDREKKFATENLPGIMNGSLAYLGTSTNHSTGTGSSQTTAAFNA